MHSTLSSLPSTPVIHDDVDEILHAGVFSEENLRVVDLVLGQDHAHLVVMCQTGGKYFPLFFILIYPLPLRTVQIRGYYIV